MFVAAEYLYYVLSRFLEMILSCIDGVVRLSAEEIWIAVGSVSEISPDRRGRSTFAQADLSDSDSYHALTL
jgi:hypothetical protein